MEVDKEMEQELEWLEAQKIALSLDLVGAAKEQLLFLAAVDRNRFLYEGPALDRAIYRYNAFWLPLLARHSESPVSEGPLVVPLDCEWVWHCHRLNPVRYKSDCEELYGRVLDNVNVVSSIKGTCRRQTVELWNRFYPEEPYDFDFRASSHDTSVELEKCTIYDLVSAVKRQSPFFYQVSKPYMNHEIFLGEAVARYKGFLHLIKRNWEKSIKRFCVPTYDIDLIWHTHQLHPVTYCKDLNESLGKILEHDDMDSDRTKGKKLDVGFSGTTKQWEETFGRRYWKAGAMYKGTAPAPVTTTLYPSNIMSREIAVVNDFQKMIQLPEVKQVEVLLEIVGIKNLPDGCKESLFVSFSKKQPDAFLNIKQKLTILSEAGEKQVASFQCEPTGELFFELVSQSPSNLPAVKKVRTIGTALLSLDNFLNPVSRLAVEKWVELLPSSRKVSSKPACLRIAVSFTVPNQAPHVWHMVQPQSLLKGCLFQLPGRIQNNKSWTRVINGTDSEVIRLQIRDSTEVKTKHQGIAKKDVIGLTESGDTHTLAEFRGAKWSLMNSQWCLQRTKKFSEYDHLFELVGHRMVALCCLSLVPFIISVSGKLFEYTNLSRFLSKCLNTMHDMTTGRGFKLQLLYN
uniref:Glycine-rich domain-containing protein 1 n=1 Tax=Rhizophora mucronata TaxID=61149 RepID=A0A2P2LCG4_RHIMU